MIKKYLYRDTIDMYVMLLASVIGLILGYAEKKEIASTIMLIVLLYLIAYEIYNHQLNKNNIFFCCKRSLLVKNKIWIAQRFTIDTKKVNGCPKRQLVKEMTTLLSQVPSGTECFCCTHDIIVKQIEKRYKNAQIAPAYTKDLKFLKKKIKTAKCDNCSARSMCSMNRSEKTQFYTAKFIVC